MATWKKGGRAARCHRVARISLNRSSRTARHRNFADALTIFCQLVFPTPFGSRGTRVWHGVASLAFGSRGTSVSNVNWRMASMMGQISIRCCDTGVWKTQWHPAWQVRQREMPE